MSNWLSSFWRAFTRLGTSDKPECVPDKPECAPDKPTGPRYGQYAGGPWGWGWGWAEQCDTDTHHEKCLSMYKSGEMDAFIKFFTEGENKVYDQFKRQHEIAAAAAKANFSRSEELAKKTGDRGAADLRDWKNVAGSYGLNVEEIPQDTFIQMHPIENFIRRFNYFQSMRQDMIRKDDPHKVAVGFYLPPTEGKNAEWHLVKRLDFSSVIRRKSVKEWQQDYVNDLPKSSSANEKKLDKWVANKDIFETTSRHELGAKHIGMIEYNVAPLPSVRGGPGSLVDVSRRYAVAWLDLRSFRKETITYTEEEFLDLMKLDHIRLSDGEKKIDLRNARPV